MRTPSLALVSNRNAAAIGLPVRRPRYPAAGLPAISKPKSVAKNSKNMTEIGVDSLAGWRLYTPHNEGGAPLATKSLLLDRPCEIQESRVSDTRRAPKPKAKRATTPRLRCLFFEN